MEVRTSVAYEDWSLRSWKIEGICSNMGSGIRRALDGRQPPGGWRGLVSTFQEVIEAPVCVDVV